MDSTSLNCITVTSVVGISPNLAQRPVVHVIGSMPCHNDAHISMGPHSLAVPKVARVAASKPLSQETPRVILVRLLLPPSVAEDSSRRTLLSSPVFRLNAYTKSTN